MGKPTARTATINQRMAYKKAPIIWRSFMILQPNLERIVSRSGFALMCEQRCRFW